MRTTPFVRTDEDEIVVEIGDRIVEAAQEELEHCTKKYGRKQTRRGLDIAAFQYGLGRLLTEYDLSEVESDAAARVGNRFTTPISLTPEEFRMLLQDNHSEVVEDLRGSSRDMREEHVQNLFQAMFGDTVTTEEYNVEEYVDVVYDLVEDEL